MTKTISQDPSAVFTGFCQACKTQDLAGAMEHVDADVVYAMYIPQDVVPFGGETHGKPAMSDRLRTIIEQFDTVQFEETITRRENDTIHGQADYAFRHKVTGETIEGVMRLVMRARDGLMVDLREYHDLEKVRAFMRLVSYVASERKV